MSDAEKATEKTEASGGGAAAAAMVRGGVRRLKRSKASAADCIRQLFDNALLSDVTFVVGEERIPAHKVVLAARSPVFEALFYPPVEEAKKEKEGTAERAAEESSGADAEAEGEEGTGDERGREGEGRGETEAETERKAEAEKETETETKTEKRTESERGTEDSEKEHNAMAVGATAQRGGGGGEEKAEGKEAKEWVEVNEVVLSDTNSDSLLRFLQFLYTDELEVTDQHCVHLLFLAKKFAVRPLEEKCNDFFMKSVTELSVCDLLANFAHADVMNTPARTNDDDEEHAHSSIVENLVEYVQQHSAQVLEADNFRQLSLENVKAILATDQLNGTELQVFNAVLTWARHHCELLGLDPNNVEHLRDVAHDLIPLVRFPAMEQSDIAGVVRESGLLTTDQLVELFSFMAVKEGNELSFCATKPREKRSITYMSGDGITLPCTNEFSGGAMNYIATKGGLESYTNPMLRGEVDVKASSWMQDADPIHFVVDRVVKRCVTRAQPMQSITIEIKRWNIRPSAYLLRHYSSWDTEALRCWVLEAATEETGDWTVLSEHKDDTHLKAKGAWHIWPLSDVTGFYRFFRITQLGQNSNNHDYLACSGFELWGTLIHV